MLQKLFGKKKDNDKDVNTNDYNFYLRMHKDIIKFLHENYPKCEDAFKFFHSVKTRLQETPTCNDDISQNTYITTKEFFDGINRIFPNKYKTNTILNYYQKIFKKKLNKTNENQKQDDAYTNIKFSEFNYVYYSGFEFDSYYTKTLKTDSKILTTRPNIKGIPFVTLNSPFPVKEHEKFETPYDLDPLEKIKRLILSSKIDFKKEFKEIINESSNGMANQFEFRNIIKRLDIGLTNIEIEDIVHKSGMSSDGKINLVDFYKYIVDENKNLVISKKHVLEQLKEIKQLIYKYYSNPRLAFELNDLDALGKIDFDKFKKIVYDLYKREVKTLPSYAVLKYVYDYIDIRKDGIIDLNEWNKIFAQAEGKLDISAREVLPRQMNILRKWETSNDIIEIYKIISKNRKMIRDKVKLFTIEPNIMLIKANDMIYVLKDVLNKIKLSQTQWKMIVSIGDKDKSGIIDFNTFISVVDTSAKMGLSHPVI
jgi:Ca2+-binding EF-hand superfamily protein